MLLLHGKKCLLVGKMVGKSLLGHEYAPDIRSSLFLYYLPSQNFSQVYQQWLPMFFNLSRRSPYALTALQSAHLFDYPYPNRPSASERNFVGRLWYPRQQ